MEKYHREVADFLLKEIKAGTVPWRQAWKPGEKVMPRNVATGRPYTGGNMVTLLSAARRRGFEDDRWGTYNQVRSLKGQVRRGERGTPLIYWKFEEKRLARDSRGRPVLDKGGEPVFETRRLDQPRTHRFAVFNAEQCDGIPARKAATPAWNPHEEAERVLSQSGAHIENTKDDRASYDIHSDRIIMPHREQFPSAATYYQSALHELAHWTGHPDRLNRPTLVEGVQAGYESSQYAREELRAEISSMMICDRLALGHDPKRNAAYVGHWVRTLNETPAEIFAASRDAMRISQHLLGPDRSRFGEREVQADHRAPEEAREPPSNGRRVHVPSIPLPTKLQRDVSLAPLRQENSRDQERLRVPQRQAAMNRPEMRH